LKSNKFTRRDVVLTAMKTGGLIGLKSLLLGLPPSFLARRVMAQANGAQFLIFSENEKGDPVNCNVPGSYVAGTWRNSSANFSAPPLYLFGTQQFQAAVPWGNLDSDLRARLNFFHHKTGASNHPESRSVLSIYGAVMGESGSGSEMLPSAAAQENYSALGTIQKEPVCMSGLISYRGLDLANILPDKLKALFAGGQTDLKKSIMTFRDQQLDLIYADLKSNGTPAQKKYLNEFALSRSQSKVLGENLLSYLTDVTGSSEADQVRAAAALIALNATPVIKLELDFGGDNHFDTVLDEEVTKTTSATANINLLWNELKKYNVQDKTTFGLINVFGRTLANRGGGRTHNGDHNVMVAFGSKINGGVTGGLDANLKASGINSANGSMTAPDITADETHHSAGKSLLSAVGVSSERIAARIVSGKVVNSFIKS
jgi:hypothetical protein